MKKLKRSKDLAWLWKFLIGDNYIFAHEVCAPKLVWFQDIDSMLNHHLAGLLA
ncbi:hypothetical protein DCAR_0102539 [Daucus carota subsp. sativus]|uniref:Uncharacterized protein n=1 Tax=Daucus carota subsp. sativus TaxID=79200 RepID=A0AAF0W6P4_DAUCS|nr:hypothetical protein DCAR_0102539 [Daucus carota subsp. sativus]